MTSCRYEILMAETDDEIVTLRDCGPHDRYRTITNDVEAVLDDLWPGVLKGRRLCYYDSLGAVTEILYEFESGQFLGFHCMDVSGPSSVVSCNGPLTTDN